MIPPPRLLRVGFWRRPSPFPTRTEAVPTFVLDAVAKVFPDRLPDVKDFVDPTWSRTERTAVLHHLAEVPTLVAAEYGFSTCRLCGMENGNKEYSDGVYLWPEGFAHYLKEHAVKPPLAFIEHVLAFTPKRSQ